MSDAVQRRTFARHVIEQVVYPSGGLGIVGWVMRPRDGGPYPVVVYNHGSRISPDGTARLDQATIAFETRPWPGVAERHCLIFFPEGRGYAGSAGPKLTDCQSEEDVMSFLHGRAEDVVAGLNWLESQAYADSRRVGLTGCSHGAVVTLLTAPRVRCRAVVAQATGAWYNRPAAGYEDMASSVASTKAPILLQHVDNDMLCPPDTSRWLYARGRQTGRDVAYKEYPGRFGIEGHSLFGFEHRELWGGDFDAALVPVVGSDTTVVTERRP